MLEFIGIFVVVYLIFMGIARLFTGWRPKREYYIVREYELDDETMDELEDLLDKDSDEAEMATDDRPLPDNVVSIDKPR